MLNIGCHLSTAKGYEHMGKEALSIGANTFQFFTRNPRGSKVKKVDHKDVAAMLSLGQQYHFAPLLGHAPYTLNACSADPRIREFAHLVMAEDLNNLEYLPNNFYTFHPGSHVGQGIKPGLDLIVELLNRILRPEQATMVLLETMSGKGSEVGSNFEELNWILQRVNVPEKLGICLDTCHVYSAGYDVVNRLDDVLEQFDHCIGLEKLKAIHLNDSMTPFDSRKDRHARIGEGTIGLDAVVRIINHPQLCKIPFYLETPNDVEGYGREITLLRKNYIGC
ncbi:MAG: endonuclease 4 [Firmicutes bacterium]|nr:endonuclease 4 [Bacillota bacterium]